MYSALTGSLQCAVSAFALAASLSLMASPAIGQVMHPTKIAGNDPSAFTTPDIHTDPTYKFRIMGRSADQNFRAGLSWTAKGVKDVDEPNTVDEFLFILKGREKYTSLDGTVVDVGAGEGIFVPKGWRGKWESDGPVEFFFAVYDPDKLYEKRSRE